MLIFDLGLPSVLQTLTRCNAGPAFLSRFVCIRPSPQHSHRSPV